MRRHVAVDLEHDLGAVADSELARIPAPLAAPEVDVDLAMEAEHATRPQLSAPDPKELGEHRSAGEVEDAAGVERPDASAAGGADHAAESQAGLAEADRGRDDHDLSPREQLQMGTAAGGQRAGAAGSGTRGRRGSRKVVRPRSDRRRQRAAEQREQDERERLQHRGHSTRLVVLGLVALCLAACGGTSSSGQPSIPIHAASVYHIAGFGPRRGIVAGKPVLMRFTILQPNGKPLTQYREGKGPHTGADLVIVRSDDSNVLYIDTEDHRNGLISQRVVFPTPGRFRVVIDAYPKQTSQLTPFNFQLFEWVTVTGKAHLARLPRFSPSEVVDGYRFTLAR